MKFSGCGFISAYNSNAFPSLPYYCPSLYHHKQPLSSLPLISFWLGHNKGDHHGHHFMKTSINQSISSSCFVVHAVEDDSQQYEIDSDKAKEALQQLDQQLKDFSEKKVSPPKIKASDVKLTRDRDEMTEEEAPEVPGSVLAYTAVALLVFTIFYNILFYTVIKPYIDGPLPQPEPEQTSRAVAATVERKPPEEAAVLQLLPLPPEVYMKIFGEKIGSYLFLG